MTVNFEDSIEDETQDDDLGEQDDLDNSHDDDEGTPPEDDKIVRYKQQIQGSKQEAERLRNITIEIATEQAGKSFSSLEKLSKKDPKLADEVAKKFGWNGFMELQEYTNSGNKDSHNSSKGLEQSEFDRLYNERKTKEEHEKAITKAKKVIDKLDDSQKEKAQAYFDKITKGKTLDVDDALEFVEMATLYSQKEKIKSDKQSDGLAKLSSTGLGTTKKPQNDDDSKGQYVVKDGKLILINKSK